MYIKTLDTKDKNLSTIYNYLKINQNNKNIAVSKNVDSAPLFDNIIICVLKNESKIIDLINIRKKLNIQGKNVWLYIYRYS